MNSRENHKTSLEIEITKLEGKLQLLNQKLDSIIDTVEKINKKVENNASVFSSYVTQENFKEYKKSCKPFLDWVESRMTIEKFLLGLAGFLGISQVVTIIVVVSEILST